MRDGLGWLLRHRVLILAWSIPVILVIWVGAETANIVNLVSTEIPYSSTSFAGIVGAFGSIALSFLLVLLYNQQAEIQREAHTPHLTGEVASLEIVSSKFVIKNSGDGYAYKIDAEWRVGDQTNSWEIPSLAPGEEFSFAVIENEKGRWVLSTSAIQEYLENQGQGTIIKYKIECEDKFGDTQIFEGKVDFEIQANRSEAPEIWDKDPIDEIRSDLSDIQGDLHDMKRYSRERKRAKKWKDRSRQSELLYDLIEEHGEMSVEEISYITSITEGNVEYRLSGLAEVGSIHFNENTKMAKPANRGDENHTIKEYT